MCVHEALSLYDCFNDHGREVIFWVTTSLPVAMLRIVTYLKTYSMWGVGGVADKLELFAAYPDIGRVQQSTWL